MIKFLLRTHQCLPTLAYRLENTHTTKLLVLDRRGDKESLLLFNLSISPA